MNGSKREKSQVGNSIRLFGEEADVDKALNQPIIAEMKQKLSTYKRRNICNIEESGLLFHTLPTRTYLSPSDGPRGQVNFKFESFRIIIINL